MIDHFELPVLTPWLGRRRAWIFVSQIGLIFCIFALSYINPMENLKQVAFWGFGIAFFSATQDIVTMAYQVERLKTTQYGAGEAMGILGYRLGMLLSGAGSLYLAEFISWQAIYQLMGVLVGVGVVTTLWCQEPDPLPRKDQETLMSASWFYRTLAHPFVDFSRQHHWILTLLVMFFYKLGDNLIGNMHNLFYLDLGFSKIEIANVSKIFGMWASIFGGIIGGVLVARLGMMKSLFYMAVIHGIAMSGYVIVFYSGPHLGLLYLTVAFEDFTNGLRITALFTYQMVCCNFAYSATQMALFTSIVHLGRIVCSAPSGLIIENWGWGPFFTLSLLANIPVLWLVWALAKSRRQPIF